MTVESTMPVNDGGPAFPPMHDPNTHVFGMTLRDYFAAHAPAEVTNLDGWRPDECTKKLNLPVGVIYDWSKHYYKLVAILSYEYADAMLQAREV